MRILVLAPHLPPTSALPGSPRLFNLARELVDAGHALRLLVPAQRPEQRSAYDADPTTAGLFEAIDELPAAEAEAGHRWRQRLWQEPDISTRLRAPRFHRAACARVAVACDDCDLLLVDTLPMTQYAPAPPRIPAVADLHDANSLLLRRQAESSPRLRQSLSLRLEAAGIARWERALGSRFKEIVTNSEVDASAIHALNASLPVRAISNGVDVDYFDPGSTPVDPDLIVFTGVMAYHPNEDAARYFCDEILPRIQQERPAARFAAVGHDPPASIRALADRRGVEVTGSVPDVRDFVRRARAFVCPLRYGTGIKNKILAAMSMGTPVVATPISMDAIGAIPDRDVLVAEGPEAFATATRRLMEDDALFERLSEAGRRFVLATHSWKSRAAEFEQVLASARQSGRS